MLESSPEKPEHAAVDEGEETAHSAEAALEAEEETQPVEESDDEDDIELDPVDDRDLQIAKLQEEVKELNNRCLRAHADLENFKRRAQREKQDSIRFANKQIFLQILDVLDNFERALAAIQDPNDNFVVGVKMIQKQLVEVLTSNGVTLVEAEGKIFDPYLHDAIAQEVTDEHEENAVIEVFQKGYLYRDSLLRPAKVKVAAAPESDGTAAGEAEAEAGQTEEQA